MVNYSNKIILDNSIPVQSITPFGLVQTVDSKFTIPLNSGQKITFSRIYVMVSVPPHLSEGVCTILFNGNILGNLDFGGFDFMGTSKFLQVEVTNETSSNNELIVKCDSLSDNLLWTVYADIYYTLNNDIVPNNTPTIGNPPSNSQSSNTIFDTSSFFNKAKPYIIGGMVLAGIGVVAYALVGTKSGRGTTINLISGARKVYSASRKK